MSRNYSFSAHCKVTISEDLLVDRYCATCCITVINKTKRLSTRREPACYSFTNLIKYGFWNKEKNSQKDNFLTEKVHINSTLKFKGIMGTGLFQRLVHYLYLLYTFPKNSITRNFFQQSNIPFYFEYVICYKKKAIILKSGPRR